MCILRTSQTHFQGACSWEGILKNSNMLGMKWLKSWVFMGIVGLQDLYEIQKMSRGIFVRKFLWSDKEHTKLWEYECLSKSILENSFSTIWVCTTIWWADKKNPPQWGKGKVWVQQFFTCSFNQTSHPWKSCCQCIHQGILPQISHEDEECGVILYGKTYKQWYILVIHIM